MIIRPFAMPDDLARQRHYLANPAIWPCWPFLPLVRRSERGQELGVLFDARGACGLMGYSATVFFQNVHTLPPTLAELLASPREVLDTVEELLANHWRID